MYYSKLYTWLRFVNEGIFFAPSQKHPEAYSAVGSETIIEHIEFQLLVHLLSLLL